MSEVIIKAENLGKKYTIGHQTDNGNYVALRDVLMRSARNFWAKTKDFTRGKSLIMGDATEEFWALRDLDFEIERGEAVGIIGRNGAGKSTLLKVLSRITELSVGRVTIKGRIASLLEVGTGFHPELTGRENIFLNGAILGMKRSEIKSKFDEIVAFAEVEKFLDTPVKRYSSGMYVRLAFAVAAHLEPEILLVDEVLAVGDIAFQKKCLGKMGTIAKEGRTILFVSHNMGAINNLCTKGLLLVQGQIQKIGDINSTIEHYNENTYKRTTACATFKENPQSPINIVKIDAQVRGKENLGIFDISDPIDINLHYTVKENIHGTGLILNLNKEGMIVFRSCDLDTSPNLFQIRKKGNYKVKVTIPGNLLNTGNYSIDAIASFIGKNWIANNKDCISFRLESLKKNLAGTGANGGGAIIQMLPWTFH
jgi:lipopolysaccharide transport system ATP-binding protein